MTRLSWPAVWRGAVTCATFAVPISVLQIWLIDSGRLGKTEAFNYVLYFAIMFCGALGGFAAARLTDTAPLQNGAAAAAFAALAIQVGGAIRRTIIGESVSNPIGWIFLALLMATFGMFGAWVNEKTAPSQNGVTR
ncbi:MAG: hypothetical protein U0Q22_19590 [Acidimicrobiales bacterium]